MKKIYSWFYKSYIGQLWLNFILFQKQRKYEKDIIEAFNEFSTIEIYEEASQRKYQEGLVKIKQKVNAQINNSFDHNKILSNTNNVIDFALDETEEQKEFRLMMEQLFVNKKQDLKNEEDKLNMINKRIIDYYELQRYNESKYLIKQIKLAKKENNNSLAERLENDWKNRFGNRVN